MTVNQLKKQAIAETYHIILKRPSKYNKKKEENNKTLSYKYNFNMEIRESLFVR